MPNIAVTFRQEITRLARREIRSQTLVLRKSSAQYRRVIAELKRQTARLKSDVARLLRQSRKDVTAQHSDDGPARIRFSAKSVSSQRGRLGISAADYGRLVGVTGHTIYKWEHGTSRPRKAQSAALASVRKIGKREAMVRLEQMRDRAAKRRTRRR